MPGPGRSRDEDKSHKDCHRQQFEHVHRELSLFASREDRQNQLSLHLVHPAGDDTSRAFRASRLKPRATEREGLEWQLFGVELEHRTEKTFAKGSHFPLGATVTPDGVNFAVYSQHATDVFLLLFDEPDADPTDVIQLVNRDKFVSHALVRGDHAPANCDRIQGPGQSPPGVGPSFQRREAAARSVREGRSRENAATSTTCCSPTILGPARESAFSIPATTPESFPNASSSTMPSETELPGDLDEPRRHERLRRSQVAP